MSGVALDVPVDSLKQPSLRRLFLAVLIGYVGAFMTFALASRPLFFLWAMPRPWVHPGPFRMDGAWSVGADIVVAALIVVVTAWWIRKAVERAVRGHVSFDVVALAVAVTACVPFLVLPPGPFLPWSLVALFATTWAVRRYALGVAPRLPKLSWRVYAALALVGFAVLGSYRVYHPLVTAGLPVSADFTLKNSDWANLTIVRVDGGSVGTATGRLHRFELPYTLPGRGDVGVYSDGRSCVHHEVVITYSVLGLTSTQRFSLTRDAPNYGSFTDLPDGAGCDEYPNTP